MNALAHDAAEFCAEEIRNPADALNEEMTRQVRRNRQRPTTAEHRAEIATLKTRVIKAFAFGVLVGLMLGVLCGGWAAGVVKAVAL